MAECQTIAARTKNQNNPDLTESELTALWWAYVADRSNIELRNRILSNYLDLARYAIASYLRRRDLPLSSIDEYVGIGWFGLVEAATKYHPSYQQRFSTYAVNGVRWAIQKAERTGDPGLERRVTIARQRRLASHAIGHRANDHDIALHMKTSEKQVTTAIVRAVKTRQVATADLSSGFKHGNSEDPSRAITDKDCAKAVLDTLSASERDVMTKLYVDDLTQRDVALQHGVSHQWISAIKSQAISRACRRFPDMVMKNEANTRLSITNLGRLALLQSSGDAA